MKASHIKARSACLCRHRIYIRRRRLQQPVATQQLASDFYGWVILRTKASHCHPLKGRYATRLAVAAGEVAVVAFQSDRSEGIFGAKTSFDGTLFDAFSRFATFVERDRFTVGVENVRTADSLQSLPALHSATFRRIE